MKFRVRCIKPEETIKSTLIPFKQPPFSIAGENIPIRAIDTLKSIRDTFKSEHLPAEQTQFEIKLFGRQRQLERKRHLLHLTYPNAKIAECKYAPTIEKGSGALERTRTSDLQVRNLLLYPLSYERVRNEIIPWPKAPKPKGKPETRRP